MIVNKSVKVYYDGDCFFCSKYATYIKLKSKFKNIEIISLRENPDLSKKFKELKMNVNNGFVVEFNDQYYFGSKGFSILNKSLINLDNLNLDLKKNSSFNTLFYNMLVFFRYIFLFSQFKSIINIYSSNQYNDNLSILFRISIFLLILTILFFVYFFKIELYIIYAFLFSSILLTLLINHKINRLIFDFFKEFTLKNMIIYYLLVFLIIHLIGQEIVIKRVIFFILNIPICYMLFTSLKKNEFRLKKYSIFTTIFIFIFLTFPGAYLTPFHQGIVGWTWKMQKTSSDIEVFLKNFDDEIIEYNHLLLQPVTMHGRFAKAFYSNKEKQGYNEKEIHHLYLNFLLRNYEKNHHYLTKHQFPNQKIFKNFSYPAHNLSKNNSYDYKDFQIDNLKSILLVELTFDHEIKKVDKKILYELFTK